MMGTYLADADVGTTSNIEALSVPLMLQLQPQPRFGHWVGYNHSFGLLSDMCKDLIGE